MRACLLEPIDPRELRKLLPNLDPFRRRETKDDEGYERVGHVRTSIHETGTHEPMCPIVQGRGERCLL